MSSEPNIIEQSEVLKNIKIKIALDRDKFLKFTIEFPMTFESIRIPVIEQMQDILFLNKKINDLFSVYHEMIFKFDEVVAGSINYPMTRSEKEELKRRILLTDEHSIKIEMLISKLNNLHEHIMNHLLGAADNIGEEKQKEFKQFFIDIQIIQQEIEAIVIDSIGTIKSCIDMYSNFSIFNRNQLQEFQSKYEEKTELIIKNFENEVKNLINQFDRKLHNLTLDQDKVISSNKLITQNIDESLENLANINKRTQSVELELSKIIGVESDKIKSDLAKARGNIAEDLNNIINESKDQTDAIKLAHSDFIGLVEKAGIYDLTNNYKDKSKEEKDEYQTYRKYTTRSIIAAIISTITVFAYAFWEQSQLPAGKVVETDYLLLVSRLSISLMFFVLALYLSKQASKHYECYQENHRTFLQLAALEPFMARMTPEEQKEIRKALIPSYFNQANDGKYASKGDEVDFSTNTTSIINNLIDKLGTKKEEASPPRNENPTG